MALPCGSVHSHNSENDISLQPICQREKLQCMMLVVEEREGAWRQELKSGEYAECCCALKFVLFALISYGSHM